MMQTVEEPWYAWFRPQLQQHEETQIYQTEEEPWYTWFWTWPQLRQHEETETHQIQQIQQTQRHETPLPKVVRKTFRIEVYYWEPSLTNLQFGHLSLRLFLDDDKEIYISHWLKGQTRSFKYDTELEKKGPDECIGIPDHMIYSEKVRLWWMQFLDDVQTGEENHNLAANNCAQVVYRALRAGSFPHFFLLYIPKLTPYEVKEWIKSFRGVRCIKDEL